MVASFVEKHDRAVGRFFEILLGSLTWGLLTSPVWLGILYPQAIVYLLAFFTVYWFYLAFRHSIGMIKAYQAYAAEAKVDWYQECDNLNFDKLPDKTTLPPSFRRTYYFLLIPVVNESEEVLKGSIDAIFNQTFPVNQVVLVYTMEEKYSEDMIKRLKKVFNGRETQLKKFMYYVHPAGIPGEAVGVAGANRSWGARHAVKDLQKIGENIRNYIFFTIDADHVLDSQFLSRVAHLYLTSDKRDHHYYSTAAHLFNNNIWDVQTTMRIEANAVTLGGLSNWGGRKVLEGEPSFSSYAGSLQTLIDIDFWDVQIGIDDTMFFWRAFFMYNGDFNGYAHYIPYSADAVQGTSYIDSHKSLYKQLLRWGWGAIDFPISMKEFLKNKLIPFSKKFLITLKLLERRVVLINIVFLITFGFGIVTLVNPLVKQTNFAYSLPNVMSLILTVALVFMVPTTYYRLKLATPMPKNWNIFKKFLVLLEAPLIIINLLTYSFIPWIDAQTRMMLGKQMKKLYHTPKVR